MTKPSNDLPAISPLALKICLFTVVVSIAWMAYEQSLLPEQFRKGLWPAFVELKKNDEARLEMLEQKTEALEDYFNIKFNKKLVGTQELYFYDKREMLSLP